MTAIPRFTIMKTEFVPYPERYHDVIETIGRNMDYAGTLVYWNHEGSAVIDPLDYPSEGKYFILNHEMPRDIGQSAWRVIDFDHPRCVLGCGRFIKKGSTWRGKQRFLCWSCDDREDW